MEFKKVSVVVPILNEKLYIRKFLDALLSQDYPKEFLEIILVDGLSSDGTVEVINEYVKKYDFIRLYTNPKKTVQYALNIGISQATGEYVVRLDAHTRHQSDYISKCIEYAEKTGADCVGGPMIGYGFNPVQNVIAAAYASPFSFGWSPHYRNDFEGYVDTVSWGCFKREKLLELGMYDERLPRSEDDDLSFRIIKNGGKIYLTPEIKSQYYPKENFRRLFKQFFDYGVWKIAVMKKHGRPLRIPQLIPMCFVSFLILFGILSLFNSTCFYLFLLGVFSYFITSFYFSFTSKRLSSFKDRLLLMWAQFVIHVSYGLGFWVGIFKFWNTKW